MGDPDLSVVVVNYESSRWIEVLLGSLFEDAFKVDGREGRLEVVVVDNASRNDDHARIERFGAHPSVRLIRNTENVGYALANNQGFHVTSGRWHLVSNPDVIVRPGCLQALIEAVETLPEAGIVGPLATMDPEGEVRMPPNELPDPWLESLVALSRYEDGICRYNVRRRARFAHRYWTVEEPLSLSMLSGGFFLGRRATFERYGLFDPGYPLYYEDTDLFRRYQHEGFALWHVPAARIVHHFSRSAGPRMKAALYRNEVGARRYFHAWFGEAGRRTWQALQARGAARARDHECPYELEELPPSAEAPALDVPAGDGVYLEVSGNPKFSLTVGIFPKKPGPYTFPPGFWDELPVVHFWCRAVDPATGDTLCAWRITKCPRAT